MEDTVRMNPREMGWECVELMHMAQDRDPVAAVVSTVMNLRFR